jgi:hypothetical protein
MIIQDDSKASAKQLEKICNFVVDGDEIDDTIAWIRNTRKRATSCRAISFSESDHY